MLREEENFLFLWHEMTDNNKSCISNPLDNCCDEECSTGRIDNRLLIVYWEGRKRGIGKEERWGLLDDEIQVTLTDE